jgi:pyruvate dehydrogenase E1 component
MKYLRERREALGGPLPARVVDAEPLEDPRSRMSSRSSRGHRRARGSTTMAFVRAREVAARQGDRQARRADRARRGRTFGMESLFRQWASTATSASSTTRSTADQLLYYKEATNGQILEEGITEAGAMSSTGSPRGRPTPRTAWR